VPGTGSTAGLTGIMVAKSTEFSYQELAKATNNFSLDHKIGQGGFGAVYYAELRGEVIIKLIVVLQFFLRGFELCLLRLQSQTLITELTPHENIQNCFLKQVLSAIVF
jgi:hypothetical protein